MRPLWTEGRGRQLLAAFATIAGLAVAMAVASIFTLQTTRNAVRDISHTEEEKLGAVASIASATQTLIITTPRVVMAESVQNLSLVLGELELAEERTRQAITNLSVVGQSETDFAAIGQVAEVMAQEARDMVGDGRRKLSLLSTINATLEQIHVAEQELALALELDRSGVIPERLKRRLDQVFLTAIQMSRIGNDESFDGLATQLDGHLRNVDVDIAADMPPALAGVLARVKTLLSSAQGLPASLAAFKSIRQATRVRLDRLATLSQHMDQLTIDLTADAREDMQVKVAKIQDDQNMATYGLIALAILAAVLAASLGLIFRRTAITLQTALDKAGSAHERLEDAVSALPEGFALFDEDGRLVLSNHSAEILIHSYHAARDGDTPGANDDPTLSEIVDLLDSGDDARVEKPLSEELLGSGEGTAERQLPDGRWVMVRIKKTRMREWVLMSTDVSRMKRREEALSRLNAVQSSVFSVLDQAIFVFNKDLLLVTANSRCEAVLGFTAEQVTPGRTLLDLYGELRGTGEETPETMQQRIAQFRDGTIPDREEIKRPSGAVIDIRRARLPDGGYTISMNDVSEDHRIRDRLAHMANHDPLTALPNRRFFDDTLSKLPSDQAGSYTIAFLNLIGFKESNETFGHAIGDQILITIAERLRSLLRPNDMAFRLGGDEFVLLVRSASSQDSAKRLGWTLNVLMAEPMELGALSVEIHPAIGLAIGPDHGETPHDVMLNAERAMIAARSGPGLRVFDAELGSAAQRRSTIRADLPSAVDANAFTVLYQPKYDLQTNKIMGMEALVRWTHPDLGPIGPGEFIPLAEKSGVIIALGERILEQATRFAKSLDDQGLGRFQIAVNVSPAQLLGQKMINTVRRVLALSGLEPHMLELEITEGILLQDDGRVPAALKALRSHGIRIAIDDFGTGYSSLSYLKRLPVDVLKIDQSFVRDLHVDPEDQRLVKTILRLAEDFDLETVAEGIEQSPHLDFLKDHRCTTGQGYLLSRPITAEAFTALVRETQRPNDPPSIVMA